MRTDKFLQCTSDRTGRGTQRNKLGKTERSGEGKRSRRQGEKKENKKAEGAEARTKPPHSYRTLCRNDRHQKQLSDIIDSHNQHLLFTQALLVLPCIPLVLLAA
jgi:hypothetical protein